MTVGGQLAQAFLTKRIPYLGFRCTETHVVELEKYLIMWVKDILGTEGHPLCRKGVVVAKAAAEADKPKGMTPKDKHNNNKHNTVLREDSDKDNNNNRRRSRTKEKKAQAVQ